MMARNTLSMGPIFGSNIIASFKAFSISDGTYYPAGADSINVTSQNRWGEHTNLSFSSHPLNLSNGLATFHYRFLTLAKIEKQEKIRARDHHPRDGIR